MTQKLAGVCVCIAYFSIGYFSLCQAQVLDERIADSLINVILTQELADSSKYDVAMEIADYATSPKISLKYAQIALEIAQELNLPKWQGAANLNIGQAYKLLGDNENALKATLTSIKYYQEGASQLGVASAYIALGNIYSQQENPSQAWQYYRQAISVFREEKDTTRLATTLLNAGELYHDNKQYDSALWYYEHANKLFTEIDFEVGIAYALGNIGLVKSSQGDYVMGSAHLAEATIMLDAVGDNYAIAEYQLAMAEIYQGKGDIDKALEYAFESWELSKQDELLQQMRNASQSISQLYSEKGNYQKAYEYQSAYLTLRDSINNEQVVRNMADMRTEFEVEQKEAEIDLLNKTKENQQLIQFGLILFTFLIIAIAIILYRYYRLQKKANKLLARQKNELHEKNKALDALIVSREKFLSIVSHDLRSPVNAFYGLSGILKDCVEEKQYEELPEMISHIEKNALSLSVLLDNLLSWAINQQGSLPVSPEPVAVKEIANEVVSVFSTMALTKGINLESSVDASVYIWVDRNAFFTILRNLINNALKFTPANGEVSIEAYQEAEQVIVQVRDTGVGMPKEKVEALFRQKEGGRTWGTSGEKGLGIGLQLVHEFVKLSQGSISVSSVEGEGTNFIIMLPAYQEEERLTQ